MGIDACGPNLREKDHNRVNHEPTGLKVLKTQIRANKNYFFSSNQTTSRQHENKIPKRPKIASSMNLLHFKAQKIQISLEKLVIFPPI